MAQIRILLASGAEVSDHDDGIEEIDDLRDRVVDSNGGRPHWMCIGDTLVFTQCIAAAQVL